MPSRRLARLRVKPAGMCCTTSTAAQQIAGQPGDHFGQRARPAGGRRDGDGDGGARCATRTARRLRDEARAREELHAAEVHLRRRAQRGEQRVRDAREVGADRARWLAHEIHRAQLEAAQGEVDAALRRRRR